jgi:hypothetical protein
MKMHRKSLMNSVAMRHLGIQYIGEEEPAPAGGANNEGGNTGGNTGGGNTTTGTQNNNGQGFDPAKFWDQPAPAAGNGSPPGGSAESGTSGGSGGQQGGNPAEDFTRRLSEVNYGQTFTDSMLKDLGEGKLDSVNQHFGKQLQQATQQSVMFAAELVKKSNDAMMARVQEMLDGKLGSRDNSDALGKEFPSYSQPGMKPVIDGIFNQAMSLTKNDRTKAIEHTRSMLRYMGSTGGSDLGLNNPPDDPHGNVAASKSLVDELLGRS